MTKNAFPIPDAALDEDIAVLGKKGGGKTVTVKGIVERLLDMERRVLVLDPLGVWAGLRTSADGKKPGYRIAIFGGLHADLPLDPAAAEPLARIIATENLPAVIDLSELSKAKQQSFLYVFLHELRRVNTDALTIVLEEADVFAPQNPQGDDSKQLHGEIDWIARRGRFRGFRLITITQRPARLSKDVLTQCSTLIAHRLPAPQDRDAVKAWVDGNGDKDKAKEVFDTLANLAVGEAWVWAPEHDLLKRAKFPLMKTLDTSSTPKAGEKRIEPKTLAQVDVKALSAALAASVAANAKVLPATKKALAELATAGVDHLRALRDAEENGYRRGLAEGEVRGFKDAVGQVNAALRPIGIDTAYIPAAAPPIAPPPAAKTPPTKREPVPAKTTGDLSPAASKLLGALARYPNGLPTWEDAAIIAGMPAGNGYFYGGRKELIARGYALNDTRAVPSREGLVVAGGKKSPLSRQEIVAIWTAKLKSPAGIMLEHVAKVGSCTLAELAQATSVKPGNGFWYGGIKALRKAGLVNDDKTSIALSSLLAVAP